MCAVVTEDEVALAFMEGEEVTTPPGSVQNQLSTNGLPDAETENDPLNYNMEETKWVLQISDMRMFFDWKLTKHIFF